MNPISSRRFVSLRASSKDLRRSSGGRCYPLLPEGVSLNVRRQNFACVVIDGRYVEMPGSR